jgi:hypothetical protein
MVFEYSTGTAAGAATSSGTLVTFTVPNGLPGPICQNDEFYLGYVYTSTNAAPNAGGNLILNVDTADTADVTANIFPPQNGTIFVVQTSGTYQYSYASRFLNTTVSPNTITLYNMQAFPLGSTQLWPLTVSNTPIYMGKSLGIRSTGQSGQ